MSFDPRTFKAHTFFGKRFSARRIDRIQRIIDDGAGISRTGLAMRVAEALRWRNPDGRPKFRACLGALERLEELGILTLPLNRVRKRASGLDAVDIRLAIRKTPVTDSLDALRPLTLQRVDAPGEAKIWNASVDHHHYLGYRHPFGCQMKYFIMDGRRRILGCLLFEGMTRNLRCRDRLIGHTQRRAGKSRKDVYWKPLAAFRRPSPSAAYPQGLVSCLYRLQDKVPHDVDLAPGLSMAHT